MRREPLNKLIPEMETIIMIDWLWMHDYDTFILRSPFPVISESIIFL